MEEEGAGAVCGGGGGRGGVRCAVVAVAGGRGRPQHMGPTCQREGEKEEGVTGMLGLLGWKVFFTLTIYFL